MLIKNGFNEWQQLQRQEKSEKEREFHLNKVHHTSHHVYTYEFMLSWKYLCFEKQRKKSRPAA